MECDPLPYARVVALIIHMYSIHVNSKPRLWVNQCTTSPRISPIARRAHGGHRPQTMTNRRQQRKQRQRTKLIPLLPLFAPVPGLGVFANYKEHGCNAFIRYPVKSVVHQTASIFLPQIFLPNLPVLNKAKHGKEHLGQKMVERLRESAFAALHRSVQHLFYQPVRPTWNKNDRKIGDRKI